MLLVCYFSLLIISCIVKFEVSHYKLNMKFSRATHTNFGDDLSHEKLYLHIFLFLQFFYLIGFHLIPKFVLNGRIPSDISKKVVIFVAILLLKHAF